MAEESGFKFISVGSDEDDDVVIQAGITDDSQGDFAGQTSDRRSFDAGAGNASAVAESSSAEVFADASSSAGAAGAASPEPLAASARSSAQDASAADAGSVAGAPASAVPAAKAEDDLTLADFEVDEPLPVVRVGILIAAVVCLVGFFVWFNVFR